MTQLPNESKESQEPEILYQSNAVPFVLRVIYLIFTTWAVVYFLLYGLPDLI